MEMFGSSGNGKYRKKTHHNQPKDIQRGNNSCINSGLVLGCDDVFD
jgi:hypothetical protein